MEGPLFDHTAGLGAVAGAVAATASFAVVRSLLGGEVTAAAVGRAFGAVTLLLLLAYGVAYAYFHLSHRTKRLSPSLMLTAALLLAFPALTLAFKDPSRSAPTAQEMSAVFVPVGGFSYEALPRVADDSLRQMFDQIPEAKGLVDRIEARTLVRKGGTRAGLVMVFGVDPDALVGDYGAQLAAGFTASSGAELRSLRLEGGPAYYGASTKGHSLLFVDPDGLLVMVQALDRPTVMRVGKGLHAANL